MKTFLARGISFFAVLCLMLALGTTGLAAEPEDEGAVSAVPAAEQAVPPTEEVPADEAEALPTTDKFIDHANWTELTTAQAQAMFDNGDNFALMYYGSDCGNSIAMKRLVLRWMETYDLKFYGVAKPQSVPTFVWSKLGSGSVMMPIMTFVTSKTSYTVTTGDQDLIETKTAFEQWAGITDSTAIGFSAAGKLVLESYGSTESTLNFYKSADNQVDSDDSSVVAKAQEITAGCTTDMQKLQAIHDWVSDNVYYDWPLYYGYENTSSMASAVLAGKRAVCQGYANLTAALCRAVGIPCRVVTGFAAGVGTWNEYMRVMALYEAYLASGDFDAFAAGIGYSNHAWNTAWVDGRWVILDTTWDSGNDLTITSHTEQTYSWDAGTTRQTYFDPSLDSFSQSHCFWQRDGVLSLDQTNLSLVIGKSGTLTASYTPSDGYYARFTWVSDTPDVATVTSGGMVRALKAGTAVVTVTGPQNQTASCTVTVRGPNDPDPNDPNNPGPAEEATATGIQLNMNAKVLKKNKSVTLKATALPAGAALGSISWSSSNAKVAKVGPNGKVTAKKNGTATITVRTASGLSAKCKITVSSSKVAVGKVRITKPKSTQLKQGKSLALKAKVSPANASSKKVNWASSNPAIAKVNSKGKVTAVAPGKVKITATSSEGGKKATITLTVKAKK